MRFHIFEVCLNLSSLLSNAGTKYILSTSGKIRKWLTRFLEAVEFTKTISHYLLLYHAGCNEFWSIRCAHFAWPTSFRSTNQNIYSKNIDSLLGTLSSQVRFCRWKGNCTYKLEELFKNGKAKMWKKATENCTAIRIIRFKSRHTWPNFLRKECVRYLKMLTETR